MTYSVMEIELGISNNAHDNIEQPVGRKKEEKEKKKRSTKSDRSVCTT